MSSLNGTIITDIQTVFQVGRMSRTFSKDILEVIMMANYD